VSTPTSSWVLAPEDLMDTPSRKDGIDELTEFDLRVYGCELIQQAGILLRVYESFFFFLLLLFDYQ
jgi:hypothetical protein